MNWDTIKNFIAAPANWIKQSFTNAANENDKRWSDFGQNAKASAQPAPAAAPATAPAPAPSSLGAPIKIGDHSFVPAVKSGTAPGAGTGSAPSSGTPAGGSASSPSGGAQAYIPWGNQYGAPQGLTQTTTPQGGTAWKDANGNMYVQQTDGFHLVTSIPGQQGKTTSYSTPGGSVSPAYVAAAQSGASGQSATDITATPGISALPAPQVQVGPSSTPPFSAGPISTTIDLGAMTSPASGDAGSAMADGSINPPTADEFNSNLQNEINTQAQSIMSSSGVDPSASYNLDPATIANGDPNILAGIQSDPSGFAALNAQFGVPQLQQQYLQNISLTGGITAAVAKLTNDIENDSDIPQWLATRQISYLANKAQELMAPYTAMANTTKAQLSYATANMRTYYSNYWKGQSMNMSQLKLALANNAITPENASQWAAATGMDATTLSDMASFKTAMDDATLGNKQAIEQSNQQLTALASSPTAVQSILSGIQNGSLDPAIINTIPARGGGAVLKLRLVQGAADMGVNLAGAGISYGFAGATNVKQQVAALQNVQALIPDMLKLSAAAPRSVGAINQYLLPAGSSIGGVNYSNFSTAVTAMADELSGALGFGSATDMSREMGYNLTDPNQTPAQFASAMQNVVLPFIQQKSDALYGQMGQYAPGAGGAPAGGGSPAAAPAGSAGGNNPLGI